MSGSFGDILWYFITLGTYSSKFLLFPFLTGCLVVHHKTRIFLQSVPLHCVTAGTTSGFFVRNYDNNNNRKFCRNIFWSYLVKSGYIFQSIKILIIPLSKHNWVGVLVQWPAVNPQVVMSSNCPIVTLPAHTCLSVIGSYYFSYKFFCSLFPHQIELVMTSLLKTSWVPACEGK